MASIAMPIVGGLAKLAGLFGNKKPFALEVYPQEVYDEAAIGLVNTDKGPPRFEESWRPYLEAAAKRLREGRPVVTTMPSAPQGLPPIHPGEGITAEGNMGSLAFIQNGGGGGSGWGDVIGTAIAEASKLAQIAISSRRPPGGYAPAPAAAAYPAAPVGSIPWMTPVIAQAPPTQAAAAQGTIATGGVLGGIGSAAAALCARYPQLCVAAGTAVGGAVGGAVYRGVRAITGGRRRYRRMNPLNARALRRALRRTQRFECFAREVMQTNRTYRAPSRKSCACRKRR